MATQVLSEVIHRISRLAWLRSDLGLSDAQLLARFAAERDEAAFAALVSRHGPMVLGVCRQLLRDPNDVDDAFQATFLVLVRKITSIRQPELLGNWLYGVAYRVALRSRTETVRRRGREEQECDMTAYAAIGAAKDPDLAPLIHEEVHRLPSKYRGPIVLCYLEGKTHEAAALHLRWPLGTLKSRLARARDLLRSRLTRHGFTLSAGAIAASLTPSDAPAAVPVVLLNTTVRAAALVAAGNTVAGSVISSKAFALSQGVLQSMFWTKIKLASVLIVAAVFAGGAGAWRYQQSNEDSAPPAKNKAGDVREFALGEKDAQTESLRTDAPGELTPNGAHFRFGTARYRHPDGINSSALSPDGKLLATAGKATVIVWDLATGKRVHTFQDCNIQDGSDTSGSKLAFSPDSKWLAQVSEFEAAALLYDVETGKVIRTFGERPKKLAGLAPPGPRRPAGTGLENYSLLRFSPDGKELLLHGGAGIAKFDPKTGNQLGSVSLPAAPEAFSGDGKQVAVLITDANRQAESQTLVVCSTETGKEETRFDIPVAKGYWGSIVAFAPDGKTVAATANPSELRLWDTASKKEKRIIKLPDLKDEPKKQEEIASIYYGPDGKTLFVGTKGHGIHRYDLGSEKELPPLRGHAWWVTGLHATGDGKTLVSTSWDTTIRRWDLAAGKETPLPEGYVWGVTSAFSPDGRRVAIADLGSGRLDLWDAGTGKMVSNLQKIGPGITMIAFSPNGKNLAIGCLDGVIRIWDAQTGKPTKTLTIPEQQPKLAWLYMNLVLFSPDGTKLLTGAAQDGLRLWDLTAGKPIWFVKLTDNSQAAFSPDGTVLATGGWESRLTFRDPATGQEKRGVSVEPDPEQRGEGTYIDSLRFSPDGKLLATTHHDGLIRLWDPVSASETRKLRGHDGVVWTVRFSPNGKWAVSGATDNTIRVWDVLTGKEVLKLVGQNAWVHHAEFSPNGKTILASGSTEALLWDARPRQPLGHDLAGLWEDLNSSDGAKAYWAMWSLSALDKDAANFLEKQIEPIKAEDPKHTAKLIADLDSDQFTAREAAAKALSKLGDRADAALRQAVKNPSSPEAERQMKLLLKDLDQGPTAEDARRSRAVQALELAGSQEARNVLAAWAKGAPGARLTEESKAVLERLNKNQLNKQNACRAPKNRPFQDRRPCERRFIFQRI